MDLALSALRQVNFDWTAHIDEIWVDQEYETERLQVEARDALEDHLEDLGLSSSDASPLGVPMLGPAGSGKTHLLGFLRRKSLSLGMHFILVDMTDVADFWETVSLGFLRSLQQQLPDGRRQVDRWLEQMIKKYGKGVRRAKDIPGQRPPGLINRANELIAEVRTQHQAQVQEHADVLRALILFACDHADVNDLGYKWLQGLVIDEDELKLFGFRQHNQQPSRIVRGLSWLLSLTAPTVLALDQLDAIVAEHELSRSPVDAEEPSDQQRRSLAIIQGIARGLMDLRDVTRRTLSVVSSLEATWDILHDKATVSMLDRFYDKLLLRPGSGPDVFQELVVGRLQGVYERHGFKPPYPTYPYGKRFFEKYQDNTPRELLKACEAHRKACRKARAVSEVGRTTELGVAPPPPPADWKARIQTKVDEVAAAMDAAQVLSDESEVLQDRVIEAACDALLLENPVPDSVFASVEKDFMATGSYDPLHAKLRLVLTAQRERELHHSFRFLEKSHHTAFQSRLKAAMTASGIDPALPFRGLTIIRVGAVPGGAATQRLIADLQARGGRIAAPSEAELRLLLAIRELLKEGADLDRFEEWLAEERPVSKMACFAPAVKSLSQVLAQRGATVPPSPAPTTPASAASAVSAAKVGSAPAAEVPCRAAPASNGSPFAKSPSAAPEPAPSLLSVGRRLLGGEPQEEVGIQLERLPYHTCVFAGSGSGKTVFLKRVIEEAALLGIPSIVIDGANDLCRLGLPWPERPAAFSDTDEQKARLYQERAEVVVWTPGAATGNPMQLQPLPDFTPTSSDPREQQQELLSAIELATTSISDMVIKTSGSTATKQTAILKGTLRHFAKQGGTIRDLVRLLAEPPEDVIEPYKKGAKLAQELSELLYAEIENDPLVGGSGAPLDPELLFRAGAPGKTRVSVLSLVGLPSYDQKRRFVDQLATTLFSWIKRNPAPAGGLLGLLVLDEAKDFVPSTKNVPGKENVRRLAAQARKYGLGLLFATQEPKSIDHGIVSNCSTLLAGKMASPAAIASLEQLLSDKGTHAGDIGKLERGTFYFGSSPERPHKIATSLCLSHHPSTPPSEAEVLEIARRSAR